MTCHPVLNKRIFRRLSGASYKNPQHCNRAIALSFKEEEFYQGLLSDYISAYRRHHSCETSLLRLTENWKASRDRKELVAVVSMDLSKAFDTIPHALLLAKLSDYGLNCSDLRII